MVADADVDANFSFALKGVSSFESFFFPELQFIRGFLQKLDAANIRAFGVFERLAEGTTPRSPV